MVQTQEVGVWASEFSEGRQWFWSDGISVFPRKETTAQLEGMQYLSFTGRKRV